MTATEARIELDETLERIAQVSHEISEVNEEIETTPEGDPEWARLFDVRHGLRDMMGSLRARRNALLTLLGEPIPEPVKAPSMPLEEWIQVFRAEYAAKMAARQ